MAFFKTEDSRRNGQEIQDFSTMPAYRNREQIAANKVDSDIAQKQMLYYGNTLPGLGRETEDYVDRLKGKLDKNVAEADQFNQQQGQLIGLNAQRAGLAGVDNTALTEGASRRGSFEAASINQKAKADALDLYGKSISNRIEGSNKIDAMGRSLEIASKNAPKTNYSPGLLDGFFGLFS